jgi:rhodanese-related sulfurtransferase
VGAEKDCVAFVGAPLFPELLPAELNVSCTEMVELLKCPCTLLNVRPKAQFVLCVLPIAINIHMDELEDFDLDTLQQPVCAVCKRGNDSQTATRSLLDKGLSLVQNVEGGMEAWRAKVDPQLPVF